MKPNDALAQALFKVVIGLLVLTVIGTYIWLLCLQIHSLYEAYSQQCIYGVRRDYNKYCYNTKPSLFIGNLILHIVITLFLITGPYFTKKTLSSKAVNSDEDDAK